MNNIKITAAFTAAAILSTIYGSAAPGNGAAVLAAQNKVQEEVPAADGTHEGIFTYNGHSYAFFDRVVNTWEEAKAFCEERGGYLAVINDQEENGAVYQMMRSAGFTGAYFGYTDSAEEGVWKWISNDTSTYENFHNPPEPNGGTIENYAMFFFRYTDGTWNDGDFGFLTEGGDKSFICEWDNENPTDDTPVTETRMLPSVSISELVDINYFSHDTRAFEETGGLKGLTATLTLQKFNVDAAGNYYDAEGNLLDSETPFYSVTKDVTDYLVLKYTDGEMYTVNSPKEVWDAETATALGTTEFTAEEAGTVPHKNVYELGIYFDPTAMNDPDFDLTEPVLMGTHTIFIGVKGDYDLNNTVNSLDAQHTLEYFLEKTVLKNDGARLDNYLDADSQELLEKYGDMLGSEDGLIFYLVNVDYREDPHRLNAADAQYILQHFLETVVLKNPATWEEIVGYDLP